MAAASTPASQDGPATSAASWRRAEGGRGGTRHGAASCGLRFLLAHNTAMVPGRKGLALNPSGVLRKPPGGMRETLAGYFQQ